MFACQRLDISFQIHFKHDVKSCASPGCQIVQGRGIGRGMNLGAEMKL